MKPIIISLVLIRLAALALAEYVPRGRRKQRKAALAGALNRLLLEHKLSLEHTEAYGERIVALDRKNRKLVWLDHGPAGWQEHCIPLLSVNSCRIVQEKEGASIQRLFLELVTKGEGAAFRLCFYDIASDRLSDLPPACRRARHWKTRVDLYRQPGRINPEMEPVW